MTTEAVEVRPLPLAATIAVAGVSFRQPLVRRMAAGDPVTVTHTPDHPQDGHACEVRNQAGQLLGFVPATLARRVVARIGVAGSIGGVVVDVVGDDPVGLRIRLTGN